MRKISAKSIVIKSLESILVTGYILFEELIWNVFAKPIFEYFKSLRILAFLEKLFLGMSRYVVLTVFLLILGLAEALGFLSGFCVINGYIFLGVFVYGLKIPVAAFTFWLFDLTKDQLMTFHWLKTTYDFIMDLIEKIINSSIHVYIKARIVALRAQMNQLSLNYFGEDGFGASVKTHYMVYKSYALNILKASPLFRMPKKRKSIPAQSKVDQNG